MDTARNSDLVEQAGGVIAARVEVELGTAANILARVAEREGRTKDELAADVLASCTRSDIDFREICVGTVMATNPPLKGTAQPGASLEAELLRRVRRRLEFQCAGCGYGAVPSTAPQRCPMCGGERWDMAPRHLFSRPLQ